MFLYKDAQKIYLRVGSVYLFTYCQVLHPLCYNHSMLGVLSLVVAVGVGGGVGSEREITRYSLGS